MFTMNKIKLYTVNPLGPPVAMYVLIFDTSIVFAGHGVVVQAVDPVIL